jgi:integrase
LKTSWVRGLGVVVALPRAGQIRVARRGHPATGSERSTSDGRRVPAVAVADLGKLLEHASAWRVLFEFLAYTGLRIGEALGVRRCDVDFDGSLLHVRQQLFRYRTLKHLKTEAGRRDVVLAPSLVRLLRERWLASPYKATDHLIFCKANGEPGDYRDAGKGFRAAVKAAGLQGQGRLSLHSLRHGFASLLIAKKLNPVFVSRQLGHSNPAITFRVYAHLFEQADSAVAAREALEASYAAMVSTTRL